MESIDNFDSPAYNKSLSQKSVGSGNAIFNAFVVLFFCRPLALALSEELHLGFVALGEDEPK